MLLEQATKELDEEELERYFRLANPDYSEHAIIRYWRGHHDHMHVRFKCDDRNDRCRSKSR
jgi:murein endopeptidase